MVCDNQQTIDHFVLLIFLCVDETGSHRALVVIHRGRCPLGAGGSSEHTIIFSGAGTCTGYSGLRDFAAAKHQYSPQWLLWCREVKLFAIYEINRIMFTKYVKKILI
jgi:hypothetical protein